MASRNVPRKATSRLDLGARAANQMKSGRPQHTPPESRSAPPEFTQNISWLSDMLTPDKNSFGVMRLVLALAVLISHSIYLTTGQGQMEPLYRWTNYTLGQHGVQLFFFLSGILVAQSLFTSGNIRDYATARGLRIFPALIVCVLLTALAIGPWLTTLPSILYLKDQGVAAYIAKTISLWSGSGQLPGVFHDNPVPRVVNSSVWTLKYEVLCYMLLAIAGFFIVRLKRWRETAFAAAALWTIVVFYKPTGLTLHGGEKSTLDVLRYFMTFFGAGVLAYALRRFIPIHASLLIPAGAVFWFAIGTRFQEPAAAIGLGYGILWLSSFTFGKLRRYTNANDYSYATYLYHMPIAQVVLHFATGIHVVPLILITSGVVLILAYLSWELVERPALQLRHKLWAPETAAKDHSEAALNPIITAIAEPKSTQNQSPRVEPGIAHVWRPIPAGRKVRIVTDDPAEAQVERGATDLPPALTQLTTRGPATSGRRSELAAEPDPRIPAGRMALATKRRAAVDSQTTSEPSVETVQQPTHSVVTVENADTIELATRSSKPRPNWSRPIETAQPTGI